MVNCVKEHKASAAQIEEFYTVMQRYEDCAVEYFSQNEANARILTHSNQETFKDQLKTTVGGFKNPFHEAALWIRGEMLDIQGMLNAIKGRDNVIQRLLDTEETKRDE